MFEISQQVAFCDACKVPKGVFGKWCREYLLDSDDQKSVTKIHRKIQTPSKYYHRLTTACQYCKTHNFNCY